MRPECETKFYTNTGWSTAWARQQLPEADERRAAEEHRPTAPARRLWASAATAADDDEVGRWPIPLGTAGDAKP